MPVRLPSPTSSPKPAISEPLTWQQICEAYPDEWVSLVEVDWIEERAGAELRTARVVGHGKSSERPFEQAEPWWHRYPTMAHLYTGNMQRIARMSRR